MITTTLKGKSLFRGHFIGWRILGLYPTKKYRQLYIAYSLFVNITISVCYPLHLMIGLFESNNISDVIENLAINLTCVVCTTKALVIWLKFHEIQNLFDIIRRQDERICLARDEARYYKNVVFKNVRFVFIMFLILCAVAGSCVELSTLINCLMGSWRLLYLGSFPFDPFASTKLYIVAHIYQLVGVSFHILQNIVHDTYAAMHLALLSGQLHALSMRVSKLGRDKKKSKDENNRELLLCVQDHKDLLEYRCKLEEFISFYMFLQIFCTTVVLCVTIVFVILFTTDPFTKMYYCSYFLAMAGEILPVCYFGSLMEYEFYNLTYALFTSNWLEQNDIFKKNFRIFIESSNKPLYLNAWFFSINLKTFLLICKNSYSLYALISTLK
ncbi:odorant receptor 59a-like [Lucilia sericata]|uniref:odorant receptor 59a-like n=1 Tax=Lucilia sericata TaxID=13632 RepID=UPI0018A81E11|nr:odorant receptor 59a-like [Lucilia sericata]XP_037815410.1 odorant receptor 59a-like [Lucilia sericata]